MEGRPSLPIPWGEMKENAILFLKVGVYGILDFLLAACGLLQWHSPRFRLCRGGAQVPGCWISRPVGAKGRVLAAAWRGWGGTCSVLGSHRLPGNFPPLDLDLCMDVGSTFAELGFGQPSIPQGAVWGCLRAPC